MSGTRLCRRDTESHPEYALLLLMSDRFETECAEREGATALVTEACCREKTAYFILGAGSTTVGYVAAEVKANRRAKRANESMFSDIMEDEAEDDTATLLQVYVEPEFRNRGYAFEALKLLLRDHDSLRVDDPTPSVVRSLERLGFATAGVHGNGDDGRPLTTFVRTAVSEEH
jgi:ribosomal protein S18 acetylase RimI-like enzyme